MAKEISRRNFLKTGAAAALGLAVVPSTVLGKKFGYTAPSDKLNILGVGIGGRGAADLQEMESQNIIGLCDVDWKYADHVFKRYPAAKKYNDYRRMYDELLKSADAVMVATADHTHAIIAAEAMTAGKHVYVEGADRIISIGDDKIVLGAGKKSITVTGENLAISDYEKGAVTIDGRISGENVE